MTDYNYIEIPRMNMKSSIFAELVKRIKELEEENEQLKELLKECESSIQYYQETYGAMDLDTYTLLAKLNEVLNE